MPVLIKFFDGINSFRLIVVVSVLITMFPSGSAERICSCTHPAPISILHLDLGYGYSNYFNYPNV